jgi:hypothetical protein
MSRWEKKDASSKTLAHREWRKTEAGQEYQKRRLAATKEWRKQNKERFKATQQRAYETIKQECFEHYSEGKVECRCCHEADPAFLQLDHKDGNGADHRRVLKEQTGRSILGGTSLYYWLKRNNWPSDVQFQILCANCNYSKRSGKYCRHELKRGLDMYGEVIPNKFLEIVAPIPINRSPERDAWLESPEGLQYREKQAAAKRGKPSPKDTRVEVPCTQCGAMLKRKQCEITRRTNSTGEARFFCNMKCSGKWKSENLVGSKVYNFKPELHNSAV